MGLFSRIAGIAGAGLTAVATRYKVLQADASGNLAYDAVHLDQAAAVTGALPTANQVAQAMAGDVGGTTAASVVSTLTGTAGLVQTAASTALALLDGSSHTASTGTIRLPNASTIFGRNALNTANIQLLALSSGNVVTLGEFVATATVLIQSQFNINLTSANSDVTVTSAANLAVNTNGIVLNCAQLVRVVSKSTTYSVVATDYVILMTGNAFTATLPAPASGRTLIFKDAAGNAATQNKTISHSASETIDGAATYVLNVNNAAIKLVSDGTNWFVIGEYNGTVI